MTNILLTLLVALIGLGFLSAWLAYRRIKRVAADLRAEIDNYKAQFIDFVTPEAEGKPSQLALFLEVVSASMGRAAAMSIKAMLMGKQSGDVRGELAEVGREQEAKMEQLGLPGVLAGAFGRSLRKKPGLFDLALPFISSMIQRGDANNGHSTTGAGGSPRFKFGG